MAYISDHARSLCRFIAAAGSLFALVACNTAYLEQPRDQPQNAADIVKSVDLKPRYPQPTGTVDTGGAAPKPFSFFGLSIPAPSAPGSPATSANAEVAPGDDGSKEVNPGADGYNLNFENAPVANVAKSVLGDVLGVGYVIDPRVQGSIESLFRAAHREEGHVVRAGERLARQQSGDGA